VILAGLAQLYRATRSRALLSEAERIARAAISRLTVRGVLAEPCGGAGCAGRLDANTQSFKGIFGRDLKVLAVTARTSEFNAFFSVQARSIEAHDTGSHYELGMVWAGPVARVSAASQASTLDALIAWHKPPASRRHPARQDWPAMRRRVELQPSGVALSPADRKIRRRPFSGRRYGGCQRTTDDPTLTKGLAGTSRSSVLRTV